MKINQIIESRDLCHVCGQTPCNCTHVTESQVNEFAPGGGGDSGDYLRALASAWYNGTFDSGSLQKGIKSQEDVERLLARGIVCPDGKVRRYEIGYNGNFDGVDIYSDDYYEHGDESGELDSRTGKPFGPYEFISFSGEDLDEGVAEGIGIRGLGERRTPKPTNELLWSRALTEASNKFDKLNPLKSSWAAKWYKAHGGTWKK